MNDQWLSDVLLRGSQGQLSTKDIIRLRDFYMRQRALSQALLEAKQLGICKMHTSISSPGINSDLTVSEKVRVT